jgi:general stress protein 26
MDAFAPEDDLTVWFGTNPNSRKVKEIQRDPRVTLYYFDPQAQGYVTLLGAARLVDDAAAKKTRWKREWEEFYPDRDKGYLLIEVRPELIEVVSPKHGVVGSSEAWAPPAVQIDPPAARP